MQAEEERQQQKKDAEKFQLYFDEAKDDYIFPLD